MRETTRQMVLVACVALAISCADDGEGSGAGPDSAPGADGAASATCGGVAGLSCADGYWCDYSDDSCGFSDALGVCREVPGASQCSGATASKVCGCDLQVHDDMCEANMAGVDVSGDGGCTPPPDEFACGYAFCGMGLQYCEETLNSASANGYVCKLLPPECQDDATCACLDDEQCGGTCAEVAPGEVIISCENG